MINPSFYQLLEIFQLTRLKFYLRFHNDTKLPEFTGSTLHGMLGHALRKYSPHANKICFSQFENQQPKPYAIIANDQNKTKWQKGEIFSFEIKLFGHAVSVANQVVTAINKFGLSDGIGSNHQKYKKKYTLISVSSICGDHQQAGIGKYKLIEHINPMLLNPTNITENASELALQLNSPLRIKRQNQQFAPAPELIQLLQNVSHRWQLLTKYWQFDNIEFLQSLHRNLPLNIRTENTSTTYCKDWQRFSIRQNEKTPQGGILGQLSYNILDDSKPYITPWLAVGEQLQIGAKTTFGLGNYTLIA